MVKHHLKLLRFDCFGYITWFSNVYFHFFSRKLISASPNFLNTLISKNLNNAKFMVTQFDVNKILICLLTFTPSLLSWVLFVGSFVKFAASVQLFHFSSGLVNLFSPPGSFPTFPCRLFVLQFHLSYPVEVAHYASSLTLRYAVAVTQFVEAIRSTLFQNKSKKYQKFTRNYNGKKRNCEKPMKILTWILK